MEECDLNEVYDRRLLIKGTLVSYIALVVYIPIGLALITLRLIFSLVSSLLVSLSPGLRTSPHFTKMYANLMGVHVQQYSFPSHQTTNNLLFVSNNRSELDLLAVKSCVSHCDFAREMYELTSLSRLVLTPVWNPEASHQTGSVGDFFKNPKNYPIVVFPEQMPSRSHTLLVFDSAAFQAGNQPAEQQLQPIAVEVHRPILPLSWNHPSSLVNTLLVLFSPFNAFHLTFLPVQTSVQACREVIAAKIGASLSSLSHDDIRKALLRVCYNL